VCILNALNGGVRDVLERDKYSFEDILGFVAPPSARHYGVFGRIVQWLMGWLESEYIEAKRISAVQQAKRRQSLPQLFVIDDEDDYDDVSASDYFEDLDLEETVWSDGMEYRYNYSNYVDIDDDFNDDEAISLIEDDVRYEDEMSSRSEVNDDNNSTFSAFILSWSGDADSSNSNSISGVDGDGDDASSLPAEVERTSLTANSCSTDEWEMLSDVASVRSIKSNASTCTAAADEVGVKSYRDAILKCAAENIPFGSTPTSKQSNNSSLLRGQCRAKTVVRFEKTNISDDAAFDYDFAHQCQKGLRGGKALNMFKGEPKTCRKRGRRRR